MKEEIKDWEKEFKERFTSYPKRVPIEALLPVDNEKSSKLWHLMEENEVIEFIEHKMNQQHQQYIEKIEESLSMARTLQKGLCSYGTIDGDKKTCDCKFDIKENADSYLWSFNRMSETCGCAEARKIIWNLQDVIKGTKMKQPDKTKQCFCQSIYNGETKQVEDCTCGKCAEIIKRPLPNQEPVERWRDEFDELGVPDGDDEPDGQGGHTASYERLLDTLTDPQEYVIKQFISHQKALSRAEVLEEVRNIFGKYSKMVEVEINGTRYLKDGDGTLLPFGYPYPDTKEKYALKALSDTLAVVDENKNKEEL